MRIFPPMKHVYLSDSLSSIGVSLALSRGRGEWICRYSNLYLQGTRWASAHTFGAVYTTTLAMHLESQQQSDSERGGSSDSAASPFSRLSLHLTFSFITDHQTRLEKRRNTRGKGAKEEWGGSIRGAKTHPIGYIHEVRLS